MLIFLDKRNRMKFDILKLFSLNEKRALTTFELQQASGHSLPTLSKLMDEIIEDLRPDFGKEILIETKEGNQKKYFFYKRHAFSLNEIQYNYLQNSIKFNLIQDLFFEHQIDIEDAAEKYFVSTSTLRRELDDLKLKLKDFEITIKGISNIELIGEEKHLRLFYTYFFFSSYQAKTWPFEKISYEIIREIQTHFPASLCPEEDVHSRVFLTYCFAVSFLRSQEGFRVKEAEIEVPLFFEKNNRNFTDAHQELIDFVASKLFDNFNLEEFLVEVKYIYSLIFCFIEYHDEYDIYPSFFLTTDYFYQKGFISNVYRDTFLLLKTLNIEEKTTTFSEVQYKITTLHYRTLLFGKAFDACVEHLVLGNEQFKNPNSYFYYIYNIIREKLALPNYANQPWESEYYLRTYSIIGSHLLVNSFKEQELNVLLIANQADYQYIVETIQSLPMAPYLKINFVSGRKTNKIDVIVSDNVISEDLFPDNKKIPILYFEPSSHSFSVKNVIRNLVELHWQTPKI